VITAVLVTRASASGAQGPSIEQVLSARVPSDLTAAPVGGHLAWVVNDRGRRNIWVAAAPTYSARQLTSYEGDDGQEITSLTWTGDAQFLLYARSGSNAAHSPDGTDEAIYRVSLNGGEPVRVTAGGFPLMSPRGNRFLFSRGGQVYLAPVAGTPDAAPLFRYRNLGSFTWSPDGTKLAVVSYRGDHTFVAVYDLVARQLRFLGPSVDRDQSPTWSPDGSKIAFVRLAARTVPQLPFRALQEGPPWSIMIADIATGSTRQLWRADAGLGSVFRGFSGGNPLRWLSGDRLVFPWEKNGWLGLYVIPAAGGTPKPLLTGEFEVHEFSVLPDRSGLIVGTNRGDLDRRRLWRLSTEGGAPEPLSSGYTEWSPRPTADGQAIAFLRASGRVPPHVAIKIGTNEPREVGEALRGYPSDALIEPELLTLRAADGMPIRAQLLMPRATRPGDRRPGILFFHGGPHVQMLPSFNTGPYHNNAYALNQYLAGQGYVVLSVNYRGTSGYGARFREAPNVGATGAAELNDILAAANYLRGRPDVDPKRIGIWGGSYGGYLTGLALSRASDLFKAGVIVNGAHEMNANIRSSVSSYNPLEQPEAARLATESSPIAGLERWRTPVLLVHGDDDGAVPFSQTILAAEGLRKRDIPVELLIFPDEGHTFSLHSTWLAAYRGIAEFLDRMLKGEPTRQ
jgi:dipeptidyl aminopeptidase/acylaminoacyl peptidase